jgi:hypothetical protein
MVCQSDWLPMMMPTDGLVVLLRFAMRLFLRTPGEAAQYRQQKIQGKCRFKTR